MKCAVVEYQRLSSPANCPLFTQWLPVLMEAKGLPRSSATSPQVIQDLWDELADNPCLTRKGDKVGLTRFFSYIHKASVEHPSWAGKGGK